MIGDALVGAFWVASGTGAGVFAGVETTVEVATWAAAEETFDASTGDGPGFDGISLVGPTTRALKRKLR